MPKEYIISFQLRYYIVIVGINNLKFKILLFTIFYPFWAKIIIPIIMNGNFHI